MSNQENNSFWISYSDLATGLMIVFMLIMLIMVILQKQATEVQTERISEITAKIEIILGQKSKLSDSINQAFEQDTTVKADPVTAQISIDQNALQFNENEASLQASGLAFIRNFTPRYICSLWNHEVRKCGSSLNDCSRIDPELPGGVRKIHVTGHADMKGVYTKNHDLSSRRAEEVVREMLLSLNENNPQLTTLSPTCQENIPALRTYAEERLWSVGAGETQHCTDSLNNSSNASIEGCDFTNSTDDSYRRVDFVLELTGNDMTGLLADMVALRKEVGQSIEGDRISNLAETVRDACWQDPSKYHGCRIFARDCLAGSADNDCSKLLESHQKLKIRNLLRSICRQEPDQDWEYCRRFK